MSTPRLRLSLTLTGACFAVLGVALLLAGLLTVRAPLTGLGASALAGLLVATIMVAGAARLRAERVTDRHVVTAGDDVAVTVKVHCLTRWLPARVDGYDEARQNGQVSLAALPVPSLGGSPTRLLTYQVPTHTRGLITLGPLTFHCADGLGLLQRTMRVGEPATVLVRPRLTAVEVAPRGVASALDGISRDTTPSGSLTFHSLRPYVSGDDPRTVHWRSSARQGELVVRQLVDLAQPRLTLVLDSRSTSYDTAPGRTSDAFELAIETLASLAAAAVERGVGCEIGLGARAHGHVGDTEQVATLLDALATTGLGGDTAVAPEHLVVGPGAALVVLTGQHADLAPLQPLARRHTRTLILLLTDSTATGAAVPSLDKALIQPAATVREALLHWQHWAAQ